MCMPLNFRSENYQAIALSPPVTTFGAGEGYAVCDDATLLEAFPHRKPKFAVRSFLKMIAMCPALWDNETIINHRLKEGV